MSQTPFGTDRALPLSVKVCYGAGGMCDSIKAVASGLYLLFFYTTVLGLPGRVLGIAAAIGLLWDALIDPLIGRLSDRTGGRFGSRHGWMLAGTAGTAAGFYLLFSPPGGLAQGQLFAWLLLTSLVLRTCQSAFVVPYYALGAELQTDYDGRTTVSGYRAAGRQLGTLFASGPALTLFFPTAQGSSLSEVAADYTRMAVALALVIAVAGIAATAGTWRYRFLTPAPAVRSSMPLLPLLRTRSFAVLTAASSLAFVGTILNAAMLAYFFSYYVGLGDGALLSLFGLALAGGGVAGVALWTRLAPRVEKHHLACLAQVIAGGLSLSAFWIGRPGGPLEAIRMPLLVVGAAAGGAAGSGLWVLASSMLADVAELREWQTQRARADGSVYGVYSAGLQIAAGVGVAVAGLLVDLYAGVVPGALEQSPQTVTRIGVLACILPGALGTASGVLMLAYDLPRGRVAEVQRALANRGAGVGATGRVADVTRVSA